MKKVYATIMVAALFLLLPAGVMAQKSPVSLYVNGEEVENEFPVMFQGQQLYVPVSVLAEHLGLSSEWDGAAGKGVLKDEKTSLHMEYSIDGAVRVNGDEKADSASVIIEEGAPYIPIQWFEEWSGIKVLWDVLTRSVFVFVTSEGQEQTEPPGTEVPSTEAPNTETPDVKEPNIPDTEAPSTVDPVETINETEILFPEDEQERSKNVLIYGIRIDADVAAISTDGISDSSSMYLRGEGDGERDRIVIDIPNARLDDALLNEEGRAYGELEVDHSIVERIRYSLFDEETNTIRVVFVLEQGTAYRHYQNFQSNEIVLEFRSDVSIDDTYLVVIDPGHGGTDPGAEGASGRPEREFSLEMALEIRDQLNEVPFIHVVMTREEDVYVPLEQRSDIANERNADLFVSVHGNSFNTSTTGTETYYYGDSSLAFASTMHKKVVQATGFSDRGVREVKYRVLNLANMPAVLLELGYLDNPGQESVMLTKEFQQRVAQAIVEGIIQYLENEV